MDHPISALAAASLSLCCTFLADAGELSVVAVDPPVNSRVASVHAPIVIHFDRPLDPATVNFTNIRAFARWSGAVTGTLALSNADQTLTLIPSGPRTSGESVMVMLSHDLRAADGSFLRAAGYSYVYWTRACPGPVSFTTVQTINTNLIVPGESSRPYGGSAADVNHDGRLDLCIVNEDSEDLRVYLNTGNPLNPFAAALVPPPPLGADASPSDTADFNNDGLTDICVATHVDNTVVVLLGNGDGTFNVSQVVNVGSTPTGITAFDADGDADPDIVNTNFASSNLSIHINNGSGVFSPPVFFEAGATGERAITAADMDRDGIMDLVVGFRTAQTVAVLRGNGNATFANIGSQSCGGAVWQMNVADLSGDGINDVATANSFSNNAAILLGQPGGTLGPATIYSIPTDPFGLATDVGDVDGDGDLDWMTSSYSGDWRLFLNNGAGAFTFHQEFNAPIAASCTLFFDMDNDGDMDMGLIDEEADRVIIMRNNGPDVPGDADGDGDCDSLDLNIVLTDFGCTDGPGACSGDMDDDGDTDSVDLNIILSVFGSSCR